MKSLLRIVPILALAAATATAGIVRLSWDQPSTGASTVTNYIVEFRSGNQPDWSSTNVGTNQTHVLDVNALLVWTFRARAQSPRGTSGPSTEIRVQAIPSAPRNLSATLEITGAVRVLAR